MVMQVTLLVLRTALPPGDLEDVLAVLLLSFFKTALVDLEAGAWRSKCC